MHKSLILVVAIAGFMGVMLEIVLGNQKTLKVHHGHDHEYASAEAIEQHLYQRWATPNSQSCRGVLTFFSQQTLQPMQQERQQTSAAKHNQRWLYLTPSTTGYIGAEPNDNAITPVEGAWSMSNTVLSLDIPAWQEWSGEYAIISLTAEKLVIKKVI